MTEPGYSGTLNVVVELPDKHKITFQSPDQVRTATMKEFHSRIIGIANQLGLQGRVIKEMQISPSLVPFRQACTIEFEEVSGGQLKNLRREARAQAREHLRKCKGSNGAGKQPTSPYGEEGEADQRAEPEGPREPDRAPSTNNLLRFPD